MHLKCKNKKSMRDFCIHRLKKRAKLKNYAVDKRVNMVLLEKIKRANAKSVLLYLPLSLEVDLKTLAKSLKKNKIAVFVPFMQGESFSLVIYKRPFVVGKYNIFEPKYRSFCKLRTIDMAVVPSIGVDARMKRIGFGKGMYDRFFAKKVHNIKDTIFVSRCRCYCKKEISERYDIEAKEYIYGTLCR